VIHESAPWKAQLLRDATLIARWAGETSSESRSFRIERRVFLAAYAMRKLDDALKVSTAVLGGAIPALKFNSTGPGFASHNNYGFDRYFDLSTPQSVELPRRRLLNLLIHSLAYVEVLGEDEAYEGFMVTSDQERERGLFQVDLTDYLGLMREVGRDYPSSLLSAFDWGTNKWINWAGQGDPPPEFVRRFNKALASTPRDV
jgi:hypothetical protein